MSIDELLFGISEKERRSKRIKRNKRKGRAAEDQVRMELELEGYDVEPVHHGADFHARRRDLLTGEVIEEKKVEVKAGKSRLSKRQRREKKNSENYEVRRRNPFFF